MAPRSAAPVVAPPAGSDWKSAAFQAAGCTSREEYAAYDAVQDWDDAQVTTQTADVTGDGVAEEFVTVNCPAPTSSRPDQVVVFGAATGGPKVLGVLARELFLSGATVTTQGTTVTVSGPAHGEDDAMCCPTYWGQVDYRWTGGSFTEMGSALTKGTQPFSTQRLADGSYTGILQGGGPGEVALKTVDWFDAGPAMEQACRQDGVPVGQMQYCTVFYYRQRTDPARVVPVAAGSTVTYMDYDNSAWSTAPLAGSPLPQDHTQGNSFFHFTVKAGQVTDMKEVLVS